MNASTATTSGRSNRGWYPVLALVVAVILPVPAAAQAAESGSVPVTIQVDASRTLGPMNPVWRFFGADEPNYATMKDGRKLLRTLGDLGPPQVYFRTHNLLTSGDGTPALKWGSTDVYSEDVSGRPVYNWKIIDGIFDAYLGNGVRPYAQIGFMPQALSIKPSPYHHEWRPGLPYGEIFTGWAQPPKDYSKWGELVYRWVEHCVARYGADEVSKWYWETWNEANIGYWKGSPAEFHKLHDFAIDAVRRAAPNARVGGPDSAGSGGKWTRDFIEHCLRGTNYATGRIGTPLDFVSFHAKGAPVYTNGHVRMGIATHLQEIDRGFSMVASYPELKNTPVVIGESDPEGCAACQGPQLAYRNGTMYSSYTAASFARIHDLALRHGVKLEGVLTWAFEFEDQPYFAGFRALASNGIDLPVLNVFRIFSRMSGQRIAAECSSSIALESIVRGGVRGTPDISALASLDSRQLAVVVWHYHDDDLPGANAAVAVRFDNLPVREGLARVVRMQIDDQHANAYSEWRRMGSPIAPTREQYDRLLEASRLKPLSSTPESIQLTGGAANLNFVLPRQGVSLILLAWE